LGLFYLRSLLIPDCASIASIRLTYLLKLCFPSGGGEVGNSSFRSKLLPPPVVKRLFSFCCFSLPPCPQLPYPPRVKLCQFILRGESVLQSNGHPFVLSVKLASPFAYQNSDVLTSSPDFDVFSFRLHPSYPTIILVVSQPSVSWPLLPVP